MGEYRIDVTAHSSASSDAVWALLADGSSWPVWSPIGSYELERAGTDDQDGLGSIRWFRTKRPVGTANLREEIVEFVPNQRMRYVVHSGLPVDDYVGTVDLSEESGGTSIRWRATFTANPVLGWMVKRSLDGVIAACAKGLAEHAAR